MNYLDFDRPVIRERNEEMVRQVRALRLEKRLRTSRKHRSAVWRIFGAWSREREFAPTDL